MSVVYFDDFEDVEKELRSFQNINKREDFIKGSMYKNQDLQSNINEISQRYHSLKGMQYGTVQQYSKQVQQKPVTELGPYLQFNLNNQNAVNMIYKAENHNPAFRAAQEYLQHSDRKYIDLDRYQIDKIIERQKGNDLSPLSRLSYNEKQRENLNIYQWIRQKRENEKNQRLKKAIKAKPLVCTTNGNKLQYIETGERASPNPASPSSLRNKTEDNNESKKSLYERRNQSISQNGYCQTQTTEQNKSVIINNKNTAEFQQIINGGSLSVQNQEQKGFFHINNSITPKKERNFIEINQSPENLRVKRSLFEQNHTTTPTQADIPQNDYFQQDFGLRKNTEPAIQSDIPFVSSSNNNDKKRSGEKIKMHTVQQFSQNLTHSVEKQKQMDQLGLKEFSEQEQEKEEPDIGTFITMREDVESKPVIQQDQKKPKQSSLFLSSDIIDSRHSQETEDRLKYRQQLERLIHTPDLSCQRCQSKLPIINSQSPSVRNSVSPRCFHSNQSGLNGAINHFPSTNKTKAKTNVQSGVIKLADQMLKIQDQEYIPTVFNQMTYINR